jgi:hypothetical protein
MTFWLGFATGFCATVGIEIIALCVVVANVDKFKNK